MKPAMLKRIYYTPLNFYYITGSHENILWCKQGEFIDKAQFEKSYVKKIQERISWVCIQVRGGFAVIQGCVE